jgi:hypothetical protein
LARLAEVEQVSELLMFLSAGMRAKSQKAIEDFYGQYEDEYPQEKAARKRFAHVLDHLSGVYGRSLDTSQKDEVKVFRSQSWFYTLFCFVHDQCFSAYLGERRSTAAPARLDRARLFRHISARAKELSKDTVIDSGLLKALRGASSDKNSRSERYRFLAKGWRSA